MFGNCLENVRKLMPLVHNITNYVTVNDVLSVAYSSTGISLNDISVVWKDVDGKIKDIVDDDIHFCIQPFAHLLSIGSELSVIFLVFAIDDACECGGGKDCCCCSDGREILFRHFYNSCILNINTGTDLSLYP